MTISTKKLFEKWERDPKFREAYDELEAEFSRAAMLIEARMRAGLTQAEVAKRMGTTQPVVARLESGKQKPSFATLEKYAKSLGAELDVRFVFPAKRRASGSSKATRPSARKVARAG